jgi:glyoxylase I family protein
MAACIWSSSRHHRLRPARETDHIIPESAISAFKVDDLDATLSRMEYEVRRCITRGPWDFSAFIPGWRTAWIADPEVRN